MRAQDSQFNCGPVALHNALLALGIKRSIKECERLTGVTATSGTDVESLLAAASAIRGVHTMVVNAYDAQSAIAILRDALRRGRPALLSVDQEEHYVAAVGLLGDRILVADGADNEIVVSIPDYRLVKWWETVDESLPRAEGAVPRTRFWACVL